MENQYYNEPQQTEVVNNGSEPKQTDNAKISMILGIVSVVLGVIGLCCCIGYAAIPCGIIAIVFANKSKADNNGELTKEAKIGMYTGIAGLVVLVLGFVLGFILGFAGAMADLM